MATKVKLEIRKAYLVKFVDPNADYDVSYTIKQNGEKVYGPQTLQGADLTENQIVELFTNEQL